MPQSMLKICFNICIWYSVVQDGILKKQVQIRRPGWTLTCMNLRRPGLNHGVAKGEWQVKMHLVSTESSPIIIENTISGYTTLNIHEIWPRLFRGDYSLYIRAKMTSFVNSHD